jgi:hypothetical protein
MGSKKKNKWRKELSPEEHRILQENAKRVCRSCGDCTECCTALWVPELHKSYRDRCVYSGKNGCGIYGNRPKSCRIWFCLWLLGLMPKRPDQCGYLMGVDWAAGQRAIQVFELRPNVFRKHFNEIAGLAMDLLCPTDCTAVTWWRYEPAKPTYWNGPKPCEFVTCDMDAGVPFHFVKAPYETLDEAVAHYCTLPSEKSFSEPPRRQDCESQEGLVCVAS